MVQVDLITEKELDKRFGVLPEKLKEALMSERNFRIVEDVCQKNRILDEEKRLIVQQVVALVILGFVHSYDVGAEIDDELALKNPQFSNSVSDELNAKIFSPIKAELENSYHPVARSTTDIKPSIISTSSASAPKVSVPPTSLITAPKSDAGRPPVKPAQAPGPAPIIISQSATATPSFGASLLATNLSKAAPAPAPPKPAPDTGWSKSTREEPVVRLSEPKASQPTSPAPKPTPAAPPPQITPIKGIGEFERIAIKESQKSIPIPPPPAKPPAPVMLHEDATFKPADKSPDFRLQAPVFDGQKAVSREPVRPAVLELGKTPTTTQTSPGTPSGSSVVHYTEYKGATQVTGPQPGQRQINEIAPAPVPTPTPATPPAAPQKVIFKDYSVPPPPPPPKP